MSYLQLESELSLYVDHSLHDRLRVNLNIEFPHVPCAVMSLDAMDVSGEQQNDIVSTILKQRLDKNGRPVEGLKYEQHEVNEKPGPANETLHKVGHPNYCGSCYGAELKKGDCCNTCDDVRKAYERKSWAFTLDVEQCATEAGLEKLELQAGEGCRIHGFFEVQKVAGNFHFAPGHSFQHSQYHVHDFKAYASHKFNTSFLINHLSFGNDYPERHNPLDGVEMGINKPGMQQYYIKVVPTKYIQSSGEVIDTHQYSVTEHFKGAQTTGRSLPGVFFIYDLSPIMIEVRENSKSFTHFLVELCAIVGGVFTVAGMVDGVVYSGQKIMKGRLGKQS